VLELPRKIGFKHTMKIFLPSFMGKEIVTDDKDVGLILFQE
jgi:hypothetical protein